MLFFVEYHNEGGRKRQKHVAVLPNICILLCWNIVQFIIHSVFCLTTGPKPPLKWFLHIVRSRASSFKWEYPLLSLRSSSSFLCLIPRLLVTSISPFIFPSITCFRRQFLRKMWPIQLAFRFLISCRIFLCSSNHTHIHSHTSVCECLFCACHAELWAVL